MPSRAYKVLYEILMKYDPLGKQSQKFWRAHFHTKGVVFKNDQIIVSSTSPSLSKPLTDHLGRDLVVINKVLRKHGFPEFSVVIKKVK